MIPQWREALLEASTYGKEVNVWVYHGEVKGSLPCLFDFNVVVTSFETIEGETRGRRRCMLEKRVCNVCGSEIMSRDLTRHFRESDCLTNLIKPHLPNAENWQTVYCATRTRVTHLRKLPYVTLQSLTSEYLRRNPDFDGNVPSFDDLLWCLMFSTLAYTHWDNTQCPILGRPWGRVIIDEAHRLRNPNSATTLAMMELEADRRWCLTGTPIQNNTREFIPIMSFLRHAYYGFLHCMACPCKVRYSLLDSHRCTKCPHSRMMHLNPLKQLVRDDVADSSTLNLWSILRPYMLRRTFEELPEFALPGLEIETIRLKMTRHEKRFYSFIEQIFRNRFESMTANLRPRIMHAFGLVNRLRQLVNHPCLVAFGADKPNHPPLRNRIRERRMLSSAKLERIKADIKGCPDGSKIAVFSEFTRMLDLIERELELCRIECVRIQGSMSMEEREEALHQFNTQSSCTVILISTRAGGEGLNVQAANTVLLIEPCWNPALDDQAVARSYRLGQTSVVTVKKYIVSKSIEERVVELQEKKRRIFEQAIEGEHSEGMGVNSLVLEDFKFLLQSE